jgi:acyl-CoA dehydrogenase
MAEVATLRTALESFMTEVVVPSEERYRSEAAELHGRSTPAVMAEMQVEAKRRGLWNLCLSDDEWGRGLTNAEYAPLAEITGRSAPAAEAINCAGPDSVNMETLLRVGTHAQKEQWLRPLADGECKSCFAMTEPAAASSDARNIATRIERSAGGYVVTGRKWWTSGAVNDRCRFAIVMGVTNPDAPAAHRHSMLVVPMDAPGLRVVRQLSVYGYRTGGHAELAFDGVEVPVDALLGEEGEGFAVAQLRLGPARIQHCMRLIGMAERALELLCDRARSRTTFGTVLADQGVIRDWIAESRIAISQARMLVVHAAEKVDRDGSRTARDEIAMIKVAVPRMACEVIDRAIQVHGGAGVSDDTPLGAMYASARTLRIADGPDEVHKMVIARSELGRQRGSAGSSGQAATQAAAQSVAIDEVAS